MKKLIFILLLIVSASGNAHAQRTHKLFDATWKFHRGDVSNGESAVLNDKNWRTLDLPHDWSIEDLPDQSDSVIGPFSTSSIGATATGYTVGGIGWYRKHFTLNNITGKEVVYLF